MNLDFKYLGKLLLDEYIILDKEFSSRNILEGFFDSLGANLLKYPELKEHLIVKYIKALRQDHAKIIGNTNLIIENQESLNKILAQVTAFGKTLKREDYINNMEFFKAISKILNEDPLYTHVLNIAGDQVTYSIIPRSERCTKIRTYSWISFNHIRTERWKDRHSRGNVRRIRKNRKTDSHRC